jgi:DNA-binding CsgD family transcriptional regulator
VTVDVAAWSTPDGGPVWLLVVTCPCGDHDSQPPAAYAIQIIEGRAVVAPAHRATPTGALAATDHVTPPPAPPVPAPRPLPPAATVPAPSAPGAGLRRLTAHELAVARLVRRAMTNREIGDALFVSRHTVNYHLRHIYRKLGVRSRVELASVLGALDERQVSATAASSS